MKNILLAIVAGIFLISIIFTADDIFAQETAPETPGAYRAPAAPTIVPRRQEIGTPVTAVGEESWISYVIFSILGGGIVFLAYKGQKR